MLVGIKRCPFCGNDDISEISVNENWEEYNNPYSVKCWKCGSQGPKSDDKSKAIKLWNDRVL